MPDARIISLPDTELFSAEVELVTPGYPATRDDPGAGPEFALVDFLLADVPLGFGKWSIAEALVPFKPCIRDISRLRQPAFSADARASIHRELDRVLDARLKLVEALTSLEDRALTEAEETWDD